MVSLRDTEAKEKEEREKEKLIEADKKRGTERNREERMNKSGIEGERKSIT